MISAARLSDTIRKRFAGKYTDASIRGQAGRGLFCRFLVPAFLSPLFYSYWSGESKWLEVLLCKAQLIFQTAFG
ncbi:MAG: hypothetical protein AB1631_22645 [Acidobacteriota bacterium]